MTGNGVLALWKDCAAGKEELFERWYQTEHMTERLSVPGFTRCRRYEALQAQSQYLTWYEVESPDVLRSATYLERLGDPTPLTSKIMAGVMKNMSRTVCHRDVLTGNRFGSVAVTVKLSAREGDEDNGIDWLRNLSDDFSDTVVLARSELWTNAEEATSQAVSKEEVLRGGDAKIEACLLLEYLRRAPAAAAADKLLGNFPSAEIGVYQLLCEQNRFAGAGLTGYL